MTAQYGMLLGAHFGAAFNTTTSADSNLVPDVFPVALNGTPYQLDLNNPSGGNFFRRDSLALLRTQADQSRTAGESSVSPENFWRRGRDSWERGAGQRYLDRESSDPFRFYQSKGINPWEPGEITLLNSVTAQNSGLTANASNTRVVVANGYLFVINGSTVRYTSGGSGTWTWNTITGLPANTPTDITTNGSRVWIAFETDGIYQIDVATPGTATRILNISSSGGTLRTLNFNKGRLFVEHISTTSAHIHEVGDFTDKDIHNAGNPFVITDSVRFAGFSWTAMTGLGGYHYFGGDRGDKSVIYKTTLAPEATALTAPVVAGELPEGELIHAMVGYLGYMLIGTDKGVRLAQVDNNGYLTVGGLVETGQPAKCLEPQDRFVWFGWGTFDGISSGLGRIDLSVFTSTLIPAYASDLMAPGTGIPLSVVTFNDKRVFTVAGLGVFAETSTPVASGYIDSGFISYGIIDRKFAVFLDGRCQPLPTGAGFSYEFSVDSGPWVSVGGVSTTGAVTTPEFFLGAEGREFEIRTTLTASATSPIVTGTLLRSYPAPKRVSRWSVPLLVFDTVAAGGRDWPMDTDAEYKALIALHANQQIFTYQEGSTAYQVVMDDYTWLPEKLSDKGGFQGTFVAQLRQVL